MVNSIFENRRAVRKYSNEAISDEKIQEMIAAFQTAPCGMHQANVMNLVVVKDEGLRNKIEEVTNNSCYNAPVLFLINTKKDSEFGRETAMDNDLSESPYYAVAIAPGIHHTMGGVKINTNTQVLNTDDDVITGLYAAGEVTGGIHGDNRIGGNAVADIVIFGRQAGEQSASFVKE